MSLVPSEYSWTFFLGLSRLCNCAYVYVHIHNLPLFNWIPFYLCFTLDITHLLLSALQAAKSCMEPWKLGHCAWGETKRLSCCHCQEVQTLCKGLVTVWYLPPLNVLLYCWHNMVSLRVMVEYHLCPFPALLLVKMDGCTVVVSPWLFPWLPPTVSCVRSWCCWFDSFACLPECYWCCLCLKKRTSFNPPRHLLSASKQNQTHRHYNYTSIRTSVANTRIPFRGRHKVLVFVVEMIWQFCLWVWFIPCNGANLLHSLWSLLQICVFGIFITTSGFLALSLSSPLTFSLLENF